MGISVDVRCVKKSDSLQMKTLKSLAKFVLNREGIQSGEVSVLITNDRSIQDLNNSFRGENSPTDVLSFCYKEDGPETPVNHLGDVVISQDTATRQAKIDTQSEVEYLLVHGLLHLVGYQDSTQVERRRMKIRQDNLISEWENNSGG